MCLSEVGVQSSFDRYGTCPLRAEGLTLCIMGWRAGHLPSFFLDRVQRFWRKGVRRTPGQVFHWPEHLTDSCEWRSPLWVACADNRALIHLQWGARLGCMPRWKIASGLWGPYYHHIHHLLLVPNNGWNLIRCQRSSQREDLRNLAWYLSSRAAVIIGNPSGGFCVWWDQMYHALYELWFIFKTFLLSMAPLLIVSL